MEPVAVWVRKGGEWAIIHRCKPLCSPPFPLDYLEEMTALMGGDGRMR